MGSVAKAVGGALIGAVITLGVTFTGTKDLQEIKDMAIKYSQKATEKIETLKSDVDKSKAENKNLNKKIEQLEKENNKSNDETVKTANGEIDKANNEIEKARKEIEKANKEVKQTKEDVKKILDVEKLK